MFRKVLIANRGEIALRVINACKELGVRTVAIYSEADRNSLHVRFADEAICIGPPRPSDSYLHVPAVISAAEIADVDAIHPGYGLLSENANFAEVCRASNIKFIGPPPEVTRLMGEKEKARQAMKKAKVPILPGSDGVVDDEHDALHWAKRVGYPVILKAKAGGGGRGMRIVRTPEELPNLYHSAFTEAANAFGNGELYMEKFIERPRHIEFQVLADEHGNVATLFERECSIQRRHQKLIEEAPSLQVNHRIRQEIDKTLRRCLSEIGYQNAGTVEFLMDEDGQIYFIEMNTRIQVEHPVTEFITGVDLVKAQLLIASGEKLSDILPPDLQMRGHAIECRINAENPDTFAPSPGRITGLNLPGGVGIRVDTHAYQDGVIPPYYDSLVAKLIAHGNDRTEAIQRMKRALDLFVVEGIHTSIPLHKRIMNEPDFVAGKFDTNFIKRWM
jgi:acetyl-CoA carboxylase, biotin carboxylase subunit